MSREEPEQPDAVDENALETREWLDSLDEVLGRAGPARVRELFGELACHAQGRGVRLPFTANTPYINTISAVEQPPYPGVTEIETRIENIVRWNAMAMVVRANREEAGIGGHIATYASAATLYEVGFNHFFRARTDTHPGDLVYFQGHASPGIYSRAFMEGRLPVERIDNFRHELHASPGLPSYPHPWLMPDFWQFPTVSMGLGPIMAIYHARFIKYTEDRGLKTPSDQRIWAFVGDGETDEPETLGAITLAAREHLDNLVFVVNCNLQRLDGPVRGNGKIIQELEAAFRGAGWNVIKVIWGSDWDPLLAKDRAGLLMKRMDQVVDGQYQKYVVERGDYFRRDFFGTDPRLLKMVEHLSDEQLHGLRRGGHDREKVYAAYKAAVEYRGAPTVVLAKTIKGYGLGEAGEGQNVTHQQKKLNEQQLREFRARFAIPISDERIDTVPFYRPPDDSPEMRYLKERRHALGGFVPQRLPSTARLTTPGDELFDEFLAGTEGRPVSTTMAVARILSKLLQDKQIGKLFVPIIPDEARTFGMEALFRQCGIYSHPGQLYEPVDKENLLYYREARDGQILEEGITEAGSLCSFIAAGTAYSNHGLPMIPFFIFYSMFGFQRVGDLIWAAGDSRCKGFLVGATSGRTTLAGEGLQHQDGNSHLLAFPIPNLLAYDPAYAYEIAVIIQDGIRRMYEAGEDVFYYLTVMNENYPQPRMPEGVRAGILKGLYRFRQAAAGGAKHRAQLLGSGAILNETLRAADILAERYGVAADVWSVTSYKELHRDALAAERWNTRHPGEPERVPYVTQCLGAAPGPIVAASDYVKALAGTISRWMPRPFIALGTDGFGRSDGRDALRKFFEVDANTIALATLAQLARAGAIEPGVVRHAMQELDMDPERGDPLTV
ncbi:MAG: pyruvate dehydrogenase (acetyl-transferring), homodimeric type [Lentisphaerae bacterium RIFOXYB12_FULL_65_16]|nr:MAG: pyruvate dehydrogenase (acetyl-transferring), homodimeric type [Lentisphaerae bacterium RIFOXYA12_64_32]OGV87012.1 MAG: pyruvate dehydrogenase (acetyl-transferring), homodimeric type [Lentisphaerae bacterium RIFOXYB12_FULL_65_16]